MKLEKTKWGKLGENLGDDSIGDIGLDAIAQFDRISD